MACLLAATAIAPAGATSAADRSAVDGGGTVQSFWLHMNSTPVSDEVLATEARRRAYIVLNAWEGALVPKLKAANPAVQVFVYKDLSSTRSYACRDGVDDAQLPTGVGYCQAEKDHPEWFLLDPDGRRFEYSGYSGHWQMDVGDTGYQQAWAANVIDRSTESGFDGVFMDNALFPCDAYHKGVCPAKYPTDAAMQDAYRSMLANTRDDFVAAGLKTVANLSNARLHAGAWDAYTEHLDGGFDEWWLTFDDTDLLSEYPEGWSRQVAEITANEAKGKITWVQPHHTQGADRPYRFALASYLLAAGDHAAIASIDQTDGYGDPTPWRTEYDWDLGTPTGPHKTVGTNIHLREFTCGTVVVNANRTDTKSVTVPLDEAHLTERGTTVDQVSLAGTTGAILRKPC
ncbi:putative glycoside hydrolase family 15 protein [Saccharothrix sp. 6-C]|uniref:putative glycoside hydrolase family 15 protein n=1 Tax=Saccharothrix sp. 6-C TaxID=2781735 RepID=UPI0019179F4A|nr:putative glycoside hydrolase family 15 protein [Saccharothrix sp. 6-C]QQQ79444.1 putative glycoside hydrolase family 15 protein [Saccharothrix sp. 6-C]